MRRKRRAMQTKNLTQRHGDTEGGASAEGQLKRRVKSEKWRISRFCQCLAKTPRICQTLANPSAARFSHFAKHWQNQLNFAKDWQNGLGAKAALRVAEAPQSNVPPALPDIGKPFPAWYGTISMNSPAEFSAAARDFVKQWTDVRHGEPERRAG